MNFGISPSIGVFLSDHVVVGTSVDVSFYRYTGESFTNGTSSGTSTSHSAYLSVGPFLRSYFGNPEGRGMPFIHVEGGFEVDLGTIKRMPAVGDPYTTKSHGLSWYLNGRVGYETFINRSVGLEYYGGIEFGDRKTDYTYDFAPPLPDETSHYTSHSTSGVFGIGLRVYLGGRK